MISINYTSSKKVIAPQLYSNLQYSGNEDFIVTLQPTVTVISGSGSAIFVNKDVVYDSYTGGISQNSYDIYLQSSLGVTPVTSYLNNTPLICSFNYTSSNSASLRWVSDGIFNISTTVGRMKKEVTASVSQTGGTSYQYNRIFTGSMASNIQIEVNTRINGLTPSATTYNIFSATDDTAKTYTRNASLWANGVNLTCIPAFNSANGGSVASNGVLVAPDILIDAYHNNMGLSTVYFVTNNNTTISASVINGMRIGQTDIWVMRLGTPITASISPAKVFDTNTFFTKISQNALYNRQVPLVNTNQFRTLRIASWLSPSSIVTPVTSSNYFPWYSAIIPGDSGTAVVSIVNSQSVAVGTWHTAGGFDPISYYIPQINQAITDMGSIYSLTTASLIGFPTYL